MDSSFTQVPLNVPKLSGFDKSFQNLLTTLPGTITPLLVDELIPGAEASVTMALSATLPPLASDTFMRCSIKCEAFFVPFRLLAGSFEQWFTDTPMEWYDAGNAVQRSTAGLLPTFGMFSQADIPALQQYFVPGSLSDYLGFRTVDPGVFSSRSFTLMPFLAYHRIWSDWYRNSLVQNPAFAHPTDSSSGAYSYQQFAGVAPYFYYRSNYVNVSTLPQLALADGVNVFALRQRNFGLDYFTTATPSPQQGAASVVSFATSGSTGQFSIAALRAANSLQQFRERNNISGNLYVEQLYARYGVRPSDGVAQRALYLGNAEFEVYNKGIFENSQNSVNTGNNPFGGSVGAQYGQGRASGQERIVSNFKVTEPGYLFVLCTLVPRVTYSSGIDRKFWHYVGSGSLSDLANPILQNVGPQPIYQSEVTGDGNVTVFGYSDRYAEFKTKYDELHGLVRDGQSLQSFALQRSFGLNSAPTINSAFLEIPTSFLDQVTVSSADVSNYGCWIDAYFNYKVAQPLAKYSLPTLQDPAYEHGKTIVVHRGGFKL